MLRAAAVVLIAARWAGAGDDTAASLLRRAALEREAGRFEEARDDIERARLLAPEDALIDVYRGYSRLYQGGGFKEAEAGLLALIARSPSAPMPHHHYAAALAVAGREREALREYEEALRLHRASRASGEDYVHTLTNLAMMYEGFGRRAEHEALLREARGLAPEGSVAWAAATAALARSAARRGAASQARRDLEQALALCARRACDPLGFADMALQSASAASTLGDTAGSSRWTDAAGAALDQARAAMDAAGTTPVDHCRAVVGGYVRLAQERERFGAAAAAAAYETAMRVGKCAPWHPQMAFVRERLWTAALQTGDLESASRHFAAAEEIYGRLDDPEGRAAARGAWAVALTSAAASSLAAGDRATARALFGRARAAGMNAAATDAPLRSYEKSLEAGDADAAAVHLSGARDIYSSARGKSAVKAAELRWASEAARLELHRAEMYRAEGRFEEAGRAAARARHLAPSATQLDIEEGYARLADGGFARAQEQFQRLIALSPADPMPHHHYAAALAFAGRRDEALREYEEALRLHRLGGDRGTTGYRHSLLNVATIYERLGRFADEQAVLREALRLEPEGLAWPWITAGLARIAARNGDAAGARRALSESLMRCAVVACEPFGEAEMALSLGALELERDGARAARAAAQAAGRTLERAAKDGSTGSRLANAELELGALYERLGDDAAAAGIYRLGLAAAGESSFHPTAASLHRRLAVLSSGEEAARHFQAARRAFEQLGDRAELAETERLARGRP